MDSDYQKISDSLIKVFPKLTNKSKKGDNGRVAVIGGSLQFTGAPYYSAISSLKVGGDISYIFCSKSASLPIKSYSPQVIVLPIFVSSKQVTLSEQQLEILYNDWMKSLLQWKNAINVWIIGPGLGRDKYILNFFPKLVRQLPQNSIVIFDADGLYCLCQHPYLLSQLNRYKSYLTPNFRQFGYLQKHINIDLDQIYKLMNNKDQIQEIIGLNYDKMYSLIIKGQQDIILSHKKSFVNRTIGGLKRCGGIGDILSGALAICIFWDDIYGPLLASRIVKMATRQAFQIQGRSLTAPSIIKQLPKIINKLQKPSL